MKRIVSIGVGVVFVALGAPARADLPAPCDPNSYECYVVPNVVLSKTGSDLPFQSKLTTGWLPSCAGGKPGESCSQLPSGDCGMLSGCVEAAMDGSKFEISMTSFFDVSWPDTAKSGKLRVTPRKKPNGGKLAVSYKLRPQFGIFVDAFGYKNVIIADADNLLSLINGPSDFDYTATGSCPFDPFAFAGTKCHVAGLPDELFQIPLGTVTGLVGLDPDQYAKLEIGLVAGTETDFSWKTTEISMDRATKKIDANNPFTEVTYAGEDYLQLNAWAVGTIGYSGKTFLKPEVIVDSILGYSFSSPLKLPIDVGLNVPFSGSIPGIALKKVVLDIHLPNLLVPTAPIQFGDVPMGTVATRTVKLSNTGTLLVRGSVATSSADIKTDKQLFEVPEGSSSELTVTFSPKKVGAFAGSITIKSNDPDQPEQVVSFTAKSGTGGSGGAGGGGGRSGASGNAGRGGQVAAAAEEETNFGSAGSCTFGVADGGSSRGLVGPALAALAALAALVARGRGRRRSGS